MKNNPLISIYTPTYNRVDLLLKRAIPSVLKQTYQNWEYFIIGDGCTDTTKEAMANIKDPRICFIDYQEKHLRNWFISGAYAANRALDLVKGAWITRIDDDDIWEPTFLEDSLDFAVSNNYDFITSRCKAIDPPYLHEYLKVYPDTHIKSNPKVGPHSSFFYKGYLKKVKYNIECYERTWNKVDHADLLLQFFNMNLRMGFLDKILVHVIPRPNLTEIGYKAYKEEHIERIEKKEKEKMEGIENHCQSSEYELNNRAFFIDLVKRSPLQPKDFLWQPYLFLNRQSLTRLLCLYKLYKKIITLPGVIMQFGVHFGRDLALFINLRGLYEPFNYSRKIIGFDTFEGLPNLHKKDGTMGKKNDFNVPKEYEHYLNDLLRYHEGECPLNHIKKFELIKGRAEETLLVYLEAHPETIVSLLYLDMDLYEPTLKVLELIEPYLVQGSIIVFDELNFKQFPGETIAFRESKFNKYKLYQFERGHRISYIVYGE